MCVFINMSRSNRKSLCRLFSTTYREINETGRELLQTGTELLQTGTELPQTGTELLQTGTELLQTGRDQQPTFHYSPRVESSSNFLSVDL